MDVELARLPPTTVRRNAWVKHPDGSHRCGNVVLRSNGEEWPNDSWSVFLVDADGVETQVHCPSRPWGYGHLGQAKIGVSHFRKVLTKVTHGE